MHECPVDGALKPSSPCIFWSLRAISIKKKCHTQYSATTNRRKNVLLKNLQFMCRYLGFINCYSQPPTNSAVIERNCQRHRISISMYNKRQTCRSIMVKSEGCASIKKRSGEVAYSHVNCTVFY